MLKFIAVVLVFNSHLDELYPISVLATGGAIGNFLFFVVSGYTWSNIKEDKFSKWYKRKSLLLWIPTVITNLFFVVFFLKFNISLKKIFYVFVYPNKSWFCGAVLLYAIGYYYLVKCNNRYKYRYTFSGLLILYIIYYIFILDKTKFSIESFSLLNMCRITFYAMSMYIGYYIKENESKFKWKTKVYYMTAIISFLGIYLLKYILSKNECLMCLQFINQILTFTCGISLFIAISKNESFWKSKDNKVIEWVANYSWEIYLTQTLIIPYCSIIVFPLNIIVALVSTVVSSLVLRKVTNPIKNKIKSV